LSDNNNFEEDKTIPEFCKELTFIGILKDANYPEWKKKLLKDIWNLKNAEDGISGDTITKMIKKTAKENKKDLEKAISSKLNANGGD